jgi:hypothetical protein
VTAPTTAPDGRPSIWPGYALPNGTYTASAIRGPSFLRSLGIWFAGIALVSGLVIAASLIKAKPAALYVCPPECGRPPTGTPVATNPRFTAPGGAFSVSYPTPGSAYQIVTGKDGVTARFTAGDGGTLQLLGVPARGRKPRDIAVDLLKQAAPDVRTAYEIPNANVGYQLGYGEVADYWPDGASSFARVRTVLLVAVKNDLALVAIATGPYHEFGPDFGPGLPSGTNLQIAEDMGKYVNSFSWKGDPPR